MWYFTNRGDRSKNKVFDILRGRLVALLLVAGGASVGAPLDGAPDPASVQIPLNIQQELAATQERFTVILEEECPTQGCFPVGCSVSRFVAADQMQNSSLPGLEDAKIQTSPQFKLMAVLCEFAFEPKLDAAELANIKQRVRQRVKSVGVELTVGTRPLTQKVDQDNAKADTPKPQVEPRPLTLSEQLFLGLIPFIPWFGLLVLATAVVLFLIWGWRRIGRSERRSASARTRASDQNSLTTLGTLDVEPSPLMLMSRLTQLNQSFNEDRRLVEVTLKKYLDESNYDELVRFVRHFGPDFFAPFKEKPELSETLGALSEKYAAADTRETSGEIWAFLDRIERDMVAAKVRIDAEPLGDNFQFLSTIGVEEFLGILREISEEEAIAAVSYAPRKLREQFFASANPLFTAKFVEHLTKVEKMSDAFVRSVAKKLRGIHLEKGESLRVVRRDTVPLFEEALNALKPDKRRKLLSDLSKVNPDFLRSVAPVVFLDDSLPHLADDILAESLMLVTPEEAAHYLAEFSWAGQVLDRLNPRLADAIRKHRPGASSDSPLASQAREKIAQFIKKQHLNGALDLIALNSKLAKEDL